MKKLLLLLLLPFLLVACPKEEIPPEEEETILAEADIGPSGGTLEAEGVSLTVPPGSFTGTFTVQISEEKEYADDFGENGASPAFRIKGIPAGCRDSLTLRIRYDVPMEDEYYLAVGEIEEIYPAGEAGSEISETGNEMAVYALYAATDSSGYLVARIPFPEQVPEDLTGLKSAMYLGPFGLVVKAVYNCFTIKGNYFTVTCPYPSARNNALSLGRYLDEAMEAYIGMELADLGKIATVITYRKKKINVVVTLQDPEKNRPHVLKMQPLGPCTLDELGKVPVNRYLASADMKLNISRTALEGFTDAEIKSWAYLWVYRMLCYAYSGSRMDWFAYASAFWMQEKYAGLSNLNDLMVSLVAMSPFNGMEAGKTQYASSGEVTLEIGGTISGNVELHATGMYPFVKYMDRRYFAGDKTLYARIMKETLLGESGTSMEGIIEALEDPEYNWWPGFFREYMTLKLTDLSADNFLKSLLFTGQIDFRNETDTTWLSDDDYPDLSAKLFKVNFLFPEFKNEASLNLKVGPPSLNMDYVTAMAFSLKGSAMEYLGQGTDLTIPGLKTMKENGYSIIVAVINSASDPQKPLPDGSPAPEDPLHIELDTRLQTIPAFNYVLINGIIFRSNFIDMDGNTTDQQFVYLDDPRQGEMNMSDYSFTASWSEPWFEGSDQTCSGTIVIRFDPARFPEYITSFSITETCEEDVAVHTRTVTGENFSLRGEPHPDLTVPNVRFYIQGDGVCSYISTLEETYTSYGGDVLSRSVAGTIHCDEQSLLDILVAVSPY